MCSVVNEDDVSFKNLSRLLKTTHISMSKDDVSLLTRGLVLIVIIHFPQLKGSSTWKGRKKDDKFK